MGEMRKGTKNSTQKHGFSNEMLDLPQKKVEKNVKNTQEHRPVQKKSEESFAMIPAD